MKNLMNLLSTVHSFTKPLLHKPLFLCAPKPTLKPSSTSPISMSSSSSKTQQKTQSISMKKQEEKTQLDNPPTTMADYPSPVSPQLPVISKDIELSRAMSAASRSSLFVLTKDDVIFEDQWLLVVNKPSGVYCENVLSSAPALIHQSTAIDSEGASEFHLANRLDRDTSGLMVITKLHKVAAKLVKAFTDHKVRKAYIALCIGTAPDWVTIRLKSGHGRSKYGAWRVYAASDVGRVLPGGSFVRDMETQFEVVSVNGDAPSKKLLVGATNEEETVVVEEKSLIETEHRDEILVRAFPKSGRTHQIRLHCQYLGMPIKGDVKYEGVCEWKGEICDRHALHAESLSFEHPMTGLPLQFQAPLPSWAAQAMR